MIAFACDRYRLLTDWHATQASLDTFLAGKRETGDSTRDKEERRYWCPGCPQDRTITKDPEEAA